MDNFTKAILKYSKENNLDIVLEDVAEQQNSEQQPTPEQNTQSTQQEQPSQPANTEEDPYPERFVYLAGLLQKALLNKFPSLTNIEPINQDNVASVIQNMENLMKQAGMLDEINTNDQSI